MQRDDRDAKHLELVKEIHSVLMKAHIYAPDDQLKHAWQTQEIKGALRSIGEKHNYRVISSKSKHDSVKRSDVEMLWDMVWLSVDQDGDITDFPLACEIELAQSQKAIYEDLRKLLLSNAAIKLLIHRTEATFSISDYLDKCAECEIVRKGDIWYIANLGKSEFARENRMGKDYGFEWGESEMYIYPFLWRLSGEEMRGSYHGRPHLPKWAKGAGS